MSKAILKFTLPKETEEYSSAANGWHYKAALVEYDQYLRNLTKYGPEEECREFNPEAARKKLWEVLEDNDVKDII